MSEHQGLIDAIRVLRIELQIANDRVAAAAGLNPRDLDVLDVIDREAPCTPSHLAARTGVRAATLTGVLARLERDGWITRAGMPGDGRSTRLSPTDRFGELRRLYEGGDSGVRRLVGSLARDERETVERFLRDAADVVREEAVQLSAPGGASGV